MGSAPEDEDALRRTLLLETRAAYTQGTGTIELMHLVEHRPVLVEGLREAVLAAYRRMLEGSDRFRS